MCYVPAGVHSLISYPLLFPGSSPHRSLANESISDGVRPTVGIQPCKSDVVLQTSCLGGLNLSSVYGVLPSCQLSPVPEGFSGTPAQGRLHPSL